MWNAIPAPPAATIAALKADELSDAPVGSAPYGALVTSIPLEQSPEPSTEVIPTTRSIASTAVTDAAPECVKPDGLKTAMIYVAGDELTSQEQAGEADQMRIAGEAADRSRLVGGGQTQGSATQVPLRQTSISND